MDDLSLPSGCNIVNPVKKKYGLIDNYIIEPFGNVNSKRNKRTSKIEQCCSKISEASDGWVRNHTTVPFPLISKFAKQYKLNPYMIEMIVNRRKKIR